MIKVEKFNVRIVNTGDKYGRNDCLTNDKAPMVEFYDSRYDFPDFMGRGQFVSRYYVSTLTEKGEDGRGLCLDGGIPEWSVSADGMKQVLQYIQQGKPVIQTNQEYIDNGGTTCPYCGSYHISGGHIQVDAGSAWQDVGCDDCGKEWQDTYTLTGFADTNK